MEWADGRHGRLPQLLPRRPQIDLEAVPLIWSRVPEVSQFWHGTSLAAPIVEQYLVSCMRNAIHRLAESEGELKQQVERFMQQESNHFQFHKTFNKRLQAMGCTALKPLENAFSEDFRTFLKSKSLRFNLAYCAGFENFSMYTALFIFGPGADIFDGADHRGADLFRWHLAEEFEHRAICHDVFRALSGNYFARVYGILFSFWHLNGFIADATSIVMAAYRVGMSESEIKQSIRSQKQFQRRFGRYVIPRLLLLIIPYYNPLWYRVSGTIQKSLDKYASMT